VRSRPGLSVAGSVVEFLRTRSGLPLVLDNCEHLLAAAAAAGRDLLTIELAAARAGRFARRRSPGCWMSGSGC
jgi:predicted ATPase